MFKTELTNCCTTTPTGKCRLKIKVSPSTPLSPSLFPPSSPLPASDLIQFSSPVDFTSVVFPLSCPQNFTCDYYLNQMVITEFFTFNLLSSSSHYLLRRGESPQSRFWATLFIAVGSHHSVLNTRVIFKHLTGHLKCGFQTTFQIFFSHYSSPHYRWLWHVCSTHPLLQRSLHMKWAGLHG